VSAAENLTMRLATLADEPALRILAERLTACPLPDWRTPEQIATADGREMMAAVRAGVADNEVWIAERSGRVVGGLHILGDTDFFGQRHAHISVIATTLDAEGTGVGAALLAHADEWARQRGFTLLTLNVFEANARARKFYEKAGWAPEMLKYAKRL
jgi:GNAT superfamily N-acetyltransferase